MTIAKDPERQLEPATLEVPPAMIGRRGGVDERAAAAPDVAAIDDEPGVVPARGITFWVRRGAWAFADQALFAASNFLLNVALARMLPPQSYGAFALGYTIFLLLGTVYTSLFVEPLLVFGAGKYRNDLSGYVRELMRFHWRGTMIAGAVLVLAGAVLELLAQRELAATLIALAVASSFILLQWLMRRACYVRFEPRLAAYAGIWYFVFLIAGGYACYRFGVLSPVSAILLMGAGSLISAAMIMVRLRVRPYAPAHDRAHPDVVAEHWEYGRWVIGASLLGWVPQSIYYLLLPLRGGLESTAALKALMNLIMPVLHGYMPMLVLMVPALVRRRGSAAFGRTVRGALILSMLCASIYAVLLGLTARPLVGWLYHGQYVQHADLLWIIGIFAITGAGIAVLGSALRALQRPNYIFVAYGVSTAVALLIGVPLMALLGLAGAAAGIAISSVATLVTMAVSLARIKRSARSA